MLAAINLDDQSALETDKIHDEGSKGLLTSELHASNLMTLEDSPKVLFCVRQVLAQLLRALCVHPPIPAFARKGGRCYCDFRAALIAPQIFAGVNGMSRCVMPSGRNASIVALTSAGNEPLQPDSPTPLAPSALVGVGTG